MVLRYGSNCLYLSRLTSEKGRLQTQISSLVSSTSPRYSYSLGTPFCALGSCLDLALTLGDPRQFWRNTGTQQIIHMDNSGHTGGALKYARSLWQWMRHIPVHFLVFDAPITQRRSEGHEPWTCKNPSNLGGAAQYLSCWHIHSLTNCSDRFGLRGTDTRDLLVKLSVSCRIT